MSIEDMEFYIDEYFPCNYPAASKIKAALRAAQQMRALLERNEANMFTLLGSVADAREAFDDATRGGE